MKTISRYIMTLALLITAATGAWAQETVETTLWEGTYTEDGVEINSTTVSEFNAGDVLRVYVTVPESGANFKIVYKGASNDWTETTIPSAGSDWLWINDGDTYKDITFTEADITALTGTSIYIYKGDYSTITKVTLITPAPAAEPDVDVTLNDDKTEASFTMPAFDATAEYELVRDMSIQMTATMGDGSDGVRYRVKKAQQGQGYEPADLDMTQVLALVAVNDGIEQKALTLNQDYFCRIYKLDEQTLQPEGDGVKLTDFDFAPGLYALKAFANDDSDYAGETPLSNTFQLYDYINITFPKGYSTHYYNESLVLDEIRNSLKFYAVTAVTSEKVTLTEIEGKAIPGGTPFIVYNETAEPITAVMGMLQADDVTSAEQFKGTAEDKDMGSQSNCYILRNGDSTPTFRLVEGAGTLPAHRCYIDLGAVAGTRSLGFDFGDGTTGIDSVESGELKVDSYYDLQGRKHQGTPQRKGVYVKDGRKVIVR